MQQNNIFYDEIKIEILLIEYLKKLFPTFILLKRLSPVF